MSALEEDGYIDSYDVCTTDTIDSYDIYEYSVIMLANDQTTSGYSGYMNVLHSLELFAKLGGVVIFGACDEGWGGNGTYTGKLPGGVEKETVFSYTNTVVDETHPIVTGELTTPHYLSTEDLDGNYCSHTHFLPETLPNNTNIILQDSDNMPTLVEYPFGNGYVIASGLTWEFYYTGNYEGGAYALKAYDDLVVYAVSLSAVDKTSSHMEIRVDNNSFTHSHSSFFGHEKGWFDNCSYRISDKAFNKLLQYYQESPYEKLPFVKNELQKARDESWGGSCLGLSLSEALTYTHRIDLSNFTGVNSGFYALGGRNILPYNTTKFTDLINYYQLSQNLNSINPIVVYNKSNNGFNDLSKLVPLANRAENTGEPFVIGISYTHPNGEGGGHALICVGCEKKANKNLVLRIIDVNTIEEYLYLTLNYDSETEQYTSFSFNKKYVSPEYDIKYMRYYTLNMFDKIDIDGQNNKETPYADVNPSFNIYIDQDIAETISYLAGAIHLKFNIKYPFMLKDVDTGNYLIYQNGEYSGTIDILNENMEINGDDSTVMLDIDAGENYVITPYGDMLDISISSDDSYAAFIANDANEIKFNLNEQAAEINGDAEVAYKVYMSYNENNDMQKIAGVLEEHAEFEAVSEGVSYSAENNEIHDIVTYTDEALDTIYEKHVDADNNNRCDSCGQLLCKLGDVNSDDKITVVDAKRILLYISNSRDLTDEQKLMADVNGDGNITVVDAKWVLQAVAGLRTLS